MDVVRVGTRGSLLSLKQTSIVTKKLEATNPGLKCELVRIKTLNEKIDRFAVKTTEKDIYTKEIDEALMNGDIDIAVHSLKDLKNELPKGIVIAAVPERANPFDVLVKGKGYAGKTHKVIGTSSTRRKVQIANIVEDAEVKELHGNVDSRLKALDDGIVDAIILAAAGLERMGYSRDVEVLRPDVMVPAIGQGALAVTSRLNDSEMRNVLSGINDSKAELEVTAERAFGRVFGIGCDVPIGALAEIKDGTMNVIGFLSDISGKKQLKAEIKGDKDKASDLGRDLAAKIISIGGDDIVAKGGQ